uniref:Uncharacterized protein n=1 Tax=Rhizophora mucronata TaxID=61149 RepID=A0A2P2PGA9_RHIMU
MTSCPFFPAVAFLIILFSFKQIRYWFGDLLLCCVFNYESTFTT